jgi:hypothetical protein
MKTLIAAALLIFFTGFTAPVRTVISVFHPPAGYTIVKEQPGSFGYYLQHLPLKPAGTSTHTYDGKIAATDFYTAGVINMSVGNRDLQQCADAVMRLRGEYLYHKKAYKDIAFNFTSGFRCDFIHYADGYRYDNERWVLKGHKDYSYANFMRYMTLVFNYAGTLSLTKELEPVKNADSLKTGDVFIYGGSPGHCFIVLNVAVNAKGQKRFILAQSYIPAQDIQVLHNQGSPWFSIYETADVPAGMIVTLSYLKRFKS